MLIAHRRRGRARPGRRGRHGQAARRAGRPGHHRLAAGAAGRLAQRPGAPRRRPSTPRRCRRLLRPAPAACSPGPRPATRRRSWSAAPGPGRWTSPRGILLGAGPTTSTRRPPWQLAAGDLLLLYSDGLIERRDRSVDDGLAMLSAAVRGISDPEQAIGAALQRPRLHRPRGRHLPGGPSGAGRDRSARRLGAARRRIRPRDEPRSQRSSSSASRRASAGPVGSSPADRRQRRVVGHPHHGHRRLQVVRGPRRAWPGCPSGTRRGPCPAPSSIASTLPNTRTSAAAVFSPTPGTPGRPSLGSPRRVANAA